MALPMQRRTVLTGAGAGLGALLAGCIGTDNPLVGEEVAGWEIEFGVLAPQEGPFERFGQDMVESLQVIEAQLEAADPDFRISYTVKDTETDPDVAADAARELVEDEGYQVLFGPCLDEAVRAVLEEVTIDADVPLISPVAAAGMSDLREREDDAGDEYHLAFSTAPDAHHIGRAFNRVAGLEGITSIALVHGDGVYADRLNSEAVEEFQLRGIDVPETIELDEEADPEELDIEGILDDLHGSDAEMLAIATNPGQGQQLLETYYANYDPKPNLVGDRLRDPELPDLIGADLEGSFAVGINPLHIRRDTGEQLGEEIDEEELEEELEEVEDEEVEVEVGDEEIEVNPLQEFHDAFFDMHGRNVGNTTVQSFDAAIITTLSIISAGEDNYDGLRIAQAVDRVASAPEGLGQYHANYGGHNYWEGVGEIGGGTVNNYLGPSGDVSFHPSRGSRQRPILNAVTWSEEADDGFEEAYPIPLQFG